MRTKKEIVTELVEKGHVTFDEALTLLETEKETVYIPNIPPIYPYYPPPYPIEPYYGDGYKITCYAMSGTAGSSFVNTTTVTQKTDVPFTFTNK